MIKRIMKWDEHLGEWLWNHQTLVNTGFLLVAVLLAAILIVITITEEL